MLEGRKFWVDGIFLFLGKFCYLPEMMAFRESHFSVVWNNFCIYGMRACLTEECVQFRLNFLLNVGQWERRESQIRIREKRKERILFFLFICLANDGFSSIFKFLKAFFDPKKIQMEGFNTFLHFGKAFDAINDFHVKNLNSKIFSNLFKIWKFKNLLFHFTINFWISFKI